MKKSDLRKTFDEDGTLSDKTLRSIEEAFEKMVSAADRKLLNSVKKKEIDAIRRRLIPTKKHLAGDVQIHIYRVYILRKFRDLREAVVATMYIV